MNNSKIITEDQVTIFSDGEVYYYVNDLTPEGNAKWVAIVKALKENNYEQAIDVTVNGIKGDFSPLAVFNDPKANLYYDPEQAALTVSYGFGRLEIPQEVSVRIASIIQSGEQQTEAVVNFFNRMVNNPSQDSVNELLGFLENSNLPITEDGCFLAWKTVRNDYTDVHSGKFDNSVGSVAEMPREEVCDVKQQTCAAGLHFCSIKYLKSGRFGSVHNKPLMVLKIDPADVVSIPTDYNNSKGRTCRYTVVGEVKGSTKDSLLGLTTNQNNIWQKPVLSDEEVEDMLEEVDDINDDNAASSVQVEETFDSLSEDEKDDESELYMTVEGFDVSVELANTLLEFIERFPETTMSNLKGLLRNKGVTPTGRMPSRVIAKFKKEGLLTGDSGEWVVGADSE